MGFLAVVNAYNMRVCLSVAITAMTKPIVKNTTEIHDSCPVSEGSHTNSSSGTMVHLYTYLLMINHSFKFSRDNLIVFNRTVRIDLRVILSN